MCSCGSEKTGEDKAYAVNVMTMMLDAGGHVGWVARQVGHSSLKMIYDHYYSYITNYQSDDGAKFMERVYDSKKKSPEKLVTIPLQSSEQHL